MTLTELAKGSATFLVVMVAGLLSTVYVDRQFAAAAAPSGASPGSTAACVDADGGWKNWPWPNVPALSPKCREGIRPHSQGVIRPG
ncbi:hypothetical protein CQ12_35345 [Bradyrhizobium jicamae]|uniref:Uncharacterized protein n=1 Tax=Bradyrhizobium jicamae TaxID=280332 RepID=A0A0R3M2F8_9BRAD|nr:hypothetical protein [Bradyrhizobium jicamae]KRR14466.1 hypothetical protein CQ12_35345 [Bradyrhizobium jicamae]